MGSCGGFQHAAIEYARNVRGIHEAAMPKPILMPRCRSSHRSNARSPRSAEIDIHEDSHLFRAYGTRQICEEYHCSFGLNSRFEELLMDGDLRVTARDLLSECAPVELTSHPFFVATLFQSERRALRGEMPPPVREFVRSAAGGPRITVITPIAVAARSAAQTSPSATETALR